MFYFNGNFGRILYTGDFRFSHEMSYDETLNSVCSQSVDVLYMDNTFCSPKCCFPSREIATQEILSIIRENSTHKILIALRNLGKELY